MKLLFLTGTTIVLANAQLSGVKLKESEESNLVAIKSTLVDMFSNLGATTACTINADCGVRGEKGY